MKKRNSRLLACALAVVLCMTAFSIPTFAAGYYASNENGNNTPPDAIESITVSTENVNLPANSSASGIPALTPDGNLTSIDDILQSAASVSTEDSLENKQFITVQSKSGNTFYIVIDRSGDTENVYFLNLVDEADLMALMGDDAEQADATCICQTHCEVGAINTDCPVCKASMPDCMGKTQTVQKDPEPVVDTKPEAVTDTKSDSAQEKSNAPLILLLLVLLGGGFALYWFKLRKPKPDTKGSADLDDYDFGEEDDADELEELDEVSTSSGFTVLSLSITLPYSSYSTPSLLSDVLSSSLLSVFSSSEESSLSESSSSVYPSSSVYSPSSEISS